MTEPDAVPQKPRAGGVAGSKKCSHPLIEKTFSMKRNVTKEQNG